MMMNKSEEIHCKFCHSKLTNRFINILLPANNWSQSEETDRTSEAEAHPTYICPNCFLIQSETTLLTVEDKEPIFLSSFSPNWLTDAKWYSDRLFKRFEITEGKIEVELLDHHALKKERDANTFYLGQSTLNPVLNTYGKADLIVCNDELWYAHDVADFLNGLRIFMKPLGMATMQFKHLLPLLQAGKLHEPFSGPFDYFSFTTVSMVLSRYGLEIFDVEEHDSKRSLLIKVKLKENTTQHVAAKVRTLYGRERDAGMSSIAYYQDYLSRMALVEQLHDV